MSDNVLTNEYMGLDSLLSGALSGEVPEDVVKGVSPWKKYMKPVFAGLILSFISVDLFPVGLITGIAGFICLFLGFRRFALENRAFCACMWMSLAGLICMFLRVVVTVFSIRFETVRGDVNTAVEIITMILMLLISVTYGAALVKAEKKAEKSIKAAGAFMVPLWYVAVRVVCFMIILGVNGRIDFSHPFLWFVALAALLALFIHAIYVLVKELEEPGYAIRTSNPRVSDLAVALAVVAAAALLFVFGLFARNYPTKWQSWAQELSPKAQTVKEELAAQGVDESTLNILSEDELLILSGGKVYADKAEDSRNASMGLFPDSGPLPGDPDAPEINIYAIDVAGSWYRLIGFSWPDGTKFGGTEGIAINAPLGAAIATGEPGGSVAYGDYISGRVVSSGSEHQKAAGLFIRNSKAVGAYRTFNIDRPFFMFYGFSVPKNAENVRGCVLLSFEAPAESDDTLGTVMLFAHDIGKNRLIAVSAREDTMFYIDNWPKISETVQHKLYGIVDTIAYK